jgi:hypothetical protein
MSLPRERDPEFVAEMIALRKRVISLVKELSTPVTIGRLSKLTGLDKHKINHCCENLVAHHFLTYGDSIVNSRGRVVKTFAMGTNTSPLPDCYRISSRTKQEKLASIQKSMKIEMSQSSNTKKTDIVTQEDIEWMQYYRARYERRYGVKVSQRFGHEQTL